MSQKRAQKNQRGRPRNSQQKAQNDQKIKTQQIKQYWTQHRITLIAYEAQYIYNKQNLNIIIQQQKNININNNNKQKEQTINQQINLNSIQNKQPSIQIQSQKLNNQNQKNQDNNNNNNNNNKNNNNNNNNNNIELPQNINNKIDTDNKISQTFQYNHKKTKQLQLQLQSVQKKRRGRKKSNSLYQTSFLFYSNNQQKQKCLAEQINIKQLIQGYKSLQKLFSQQNKNPNDIQVRSFIKIMLQLKNHNIITQFVIIYDLIYKQISTILFQQVQKQQSRKQIIKNIQNKLTQLIQTNQKKFKYFSQYLKNDKQQTNKLLYVQTYCLLAQRLNFNINQFYAEAFSITLTEKSKKKQEGGKKIKLE